MDRSTLAPETRGYPVSLRLLKQPPVLRVRGALPSRPGVAIVGTREPSAEGASFAFDAARALATSGVPVFSGGALGIDTAAHRGALDAGGLTVAVLGGGLDRIFPRENAALFDAIVAAKGAVLSPVGDDVPPAPYRFHLRNSVLATMSALVILVECGLESGALNTTKWARSFSIPWAVVPNAPWSPSGAGCALELARGGRVVTSPAGVVRLYREVLALPTDVARTVPRGRRTEPSPAQATLALPAAPPVEAGADGAPDDATARGILAVLAGAPATIGDIAERVGAPPTELAERLLELSFARRVEEVTPGVYRLATLSLGRSGRRE